MFVCLSVFVVFRVRGVVEWVGSDDLWVVIRSIGFVWV